MQVHVKQPEIVPEINLEPASVAECPTCQRQQPVVKTRKTLLSEMYLCAHCRSIFSVGDKGATRKLAHVLHEAAAMEVLF